MNPQYTLRASEPKMSLTQLLLVSHSEMASESCDQSKLQPADSSNTTIPQAFHCRHIDPSFNCNLTAPIPISKSNLNCFHRLHVTFFKKTQFTTKINKYIPVSEQQVWKKNLNSQHFSMHELKIYYRFNNVLIFLKNAFRYVCEQHLIWTSGKE